VRREADQAKTAWRRRAGGAAASLALHVLVLAGLVLAIRTPPPLRELKPVTVELVPLRPPPERERVRPHAPSAGSAPVLNLPARRTTSATVLAGAATEPPARTEGGETGPPREGTALRDYMACAHPDFFGLTEKQVSDCDEANFPGRGRSGIAFIGVDPAKLARWDQDLKRFHEPPAAPFVPCEGPGSNLGAGCPNHQVNGP
jgi:hypothetical protein